MSHINKTIDDEKGISQLVIGTENKSILILDPSGSNISQEFKLSSTPVYILSEGLIDTDYKLTILCRDGKIYEIKNGHVFFKK